MNLDKLRHVQSKERAHDSLQSLDDSFYSDVTSYLNELHAERETAADATADPFDDTRITRLTDEFTTAQHVVEAIYERRLGKLIDQAAIAATGTPTDTTALTPEEQELFETLVETLEQHKETVLTPLTAPPSETQTRPTDETGAAETTPMQTTEDVAAAAVISSETSSPPTSEDSQTPATPQPDQPDRPDASTTDTPTATTEATTASEQTESEEHTGRDTTEPIERQTVRITVDVGEIIGVDDRTYDLETGDVVTLPAVNATPLIEKDAAEPVE